MSVSESETRLRNVETVLRNRDSGQPVIGSRLESGRRGLCQAFYVLSGTETGIRSHLETIQAEVIVTRLAAWKQLAATFSRYLSSSVPKAIAGRYAGLVMAATGRVILAQA